MRGLCAILLLAALVKMGIAPHSANVRSLAATTIETPAVAAAGASDSATQPTAGLTPPRIDGKAFAVLDAPCGNFVYGKNEHQRLPPASLTKILTALVTIRNVSLSSSVDVQVDGAGMAASGSTVMGIEPGMHLTVQDLLYGLFLSSGNDAAQALAQFVAGDPLHFAGLMNQEAARLGLHDSNFTNPHGLDSPRLYSSAYDLAMAGWELLKDPILAAISSAPAYTPTSRDWPGAELKNGNKLLQLYPGAFGVKIGYTDRANQTIVAAAARGDRRLIVTILGSSDRYGDAISLLNWAFASTADACATLLSSGS